MADETVVKGLRELQNFMNALPVKVEQNLARGAVRAGITVVKPIAQSMVHSVSGQLARGLRVATRKRGSAIIGRLRATGPHAHIAPMVEYGTQAHIITIKVKAALAVGGGRYRKSVQHPGARPRPFMRPALDQAAQAATIAAGNFIKQKLQSQHGLDTADIKVAGDD